MTSCKYYNWTLIILLLLTVTSCKKFEREQEIKKFLLDKVNINIDDVKDVNVVIFQYQICGACTPAILSSFKNWDLKNLIVITGDHSKLHLDTLQSKTDAKVIIDRDRSIERYGLRYARDIIILFRNGKIAYYNFITDENLNQIERAINRNQLVQR